MQNLAKKVSVILPVYNTEPYLDRCIESILTQTFADFELIIVDDGSTDGSGKICDYYATRDERVRVLHEVNSGVSAARNIGLKHMTGDWVTFVDSDDWLEPSALQIMKESLELNGVDCVRTTHFIDTQTSQKKVRLNIPEGIYKGERLAYLMEVFAAGKEQCYTPLLMIRSGMLESITFNEGLHVMEDKCFYVEVLMKVNGLLLLDHPTYHYFRNINSATQSYGRRRVNIISIVKAHQQIIKVLRKGDRLTRSLHETLSTNHTFLTTSLLYSFYKENRSESKNVYSFLDELARYSDYVSMVKASNIKNTTFKQSAIIFIGRATIYHDRRMVVVLFKLSIVAKRIIVLLRIRH